MTTSKGQMLSVRCGRLVRRSRRPKHKMARFKRGRLSCWNYRGYCVSEKWPGNAGVRWQMADENGEWGWFFRTLAEFRRTCDRWERQRAKEANTPNTKVSHGGA
jgi:hypothetical protein